MVTAIVISGGSGSRTGQAIPKQYLTVNDIPVIAYTLMNIQKAKEIDKIVVVVAKGWESFVYAYAEQFGVTKCKNVVFGGSTRNESIYNGLCAVKEDGETEKICIVDANRPLIPQEVFTRAISLIDNCDVVLTAQPCYDSMFYSLDGEYANQNIERSMIFKGQTPECARLCTMLELYSEESARQDTTLSTSGLAIEKGMRVLMARGHVKCFKITTVDDFVLFKAYLTAENTPNLI